MPSLFTVTAVCCILIVVLACSGDKVQGDIHPDIPELPTINSQQLRVEALPHIITLQYAADGTIHAFGSLPEDTVMPQKGYKHLLVYDKNFQLLSTQLITKRKLGIAFVDPQSNLYIINEHRKLIQLQYPHYKEEIELPPHPITPKLQAIVNQELRLGRPREAEYRQLMKEGKEATIKANQKEVIQALQECYEQHLNLDAIDYGILHYNKYTLFMKDGAVYTLENYQGMNGQASISKLFKQQQQVTIYKHYDREDKGYSIANMMLLEQQETGNSPVQKRLVETDFAVTEKKSTIENWPNGGYTKGFYYYQLNFNKASAKFKIKGSKTAKKARLYILGKEEYPICFLAGRGWYLVKKKEK